MTELTLVDVGGAEIDPRELITDELIGYVENLNPTLGKEGDPYFKEYQAFLEEINAAGIATIDPDAMSTGRFDDIDLSGDDVETKELSDSFFAVAPSTDAAIIAAMMMTPMDFSDGAEFAFSEEYVDAFYELFSLKG